MNRKEVSSSLPSTVERLLTVPPPPPPTAEILLENIDELKSVVDEQDEKIMELQDKNEELSNKLNLLKDQVNNLKHTSNQNEDTHGKEDYVFYSRQNGGAIQQENEEDTELGIALPNSTRQENNSPYTYYRKPGSRVYTSSAARLMFAFLFLGCMVLEQKLKMDYPDEPDRLNLLAIVSYATYSFLVVSFATLFRNIYEKEDCIYLCGWLVNMASALSFFQSMYIFSEYNNDDNDKDWEINASTGRSFILLGCGHVIELVYLLYTTNLQYKSYIVSLVLVIAGSFTGRFSDYHMIAPCCFILHSIVNYIALYYDKPSRQRTDQESRNEEGGKDPKPNPLADHMMDCYVFMMISSDIGAWHLGFVVFIVQSLMMALCLSQIVFFDNSSGLLLGATLNASAARYVAQFCALVLSICWQRDMQASIEMLSMFWYDGNGTWPYDKLGLKDGRFRIWFDKVFFPNVLRFIQGLTELFTSFVIIVQSTSTFDLFKDFTALLLISDIDNVVFSLACEGYFGDHIRDESEKVININVVDKKRKFCGVPVRFFVLFVIFILMFLGWVYFVYHQASKSFFLQLYPDCNITNLEHAANFVCDSEYNTAECGYDGGDCI